MIQIRAGHSNTFSLNQKKFIGLQYKQSTKTIFAVQQTISIVIISMALSIRIVKNNPRKVEAPNPQQFPNFKSWIWLFWPKTFSVFGPFQAVVLGLFQPLFWLYWPEIVRCICLGRGVSTVQKVWGRKNFGSRLRRSQHFTNFCMYWKL